MGHKPFVYPFFLYPIMGLNYHMKDKEILSYVKLDLTKQVSKPKKQVADVQLNRRDLVIGANGSLMDKNSFTEWESDKRNASYE
jgi:hypothetical protein